MLIRTAATHNAARNDETQSDRTENDVSHGARSDEGSGFMYPGSQRTRHVGP